MSNSAVTSLAILKVNWERLGRDYLDNLVPFVVSVVCDGSSGPVSLPEVQEAVRDAYGLTIPLNPLKTILSRMAREDQGHLRRDSGVYFKQAHHCENDQFLAVRKAASEHIDKLVAKLSSFALSTFQLTWTPEVAERALLSFVSDEGLEALYAKAEGRVVPAVDSGVEEQLVVGSFVVALQNTEPAVFEEFLGIVKGYVLSNALYLPDTASVQQRFNNTTVYFDTGFLNAACGFAGPDRQAPCSELILLLKTYGARLGCFRETVEEVRGILNACATAIRKKEVRQFTFPSFEHFLQAGVPSTDIDLLAARCEKHIEALGVRIEDRPSVDPARNIDEGGLEKELMDAIHYKNKSALVHDVDCIAAIMRHRRGAESHTIENSRAIFVTTNGLLAAAARRFLQPDATPGAVAPVMSSHALGHILWLKDPTKAPTLPLQRVIADAAAAMQPPEALWKLYLVEIAKLEAAGSITSEQYLLLRHSHSAKRALMDLTRGDPDAFAEGTVPEILEVARQNLRADLEDKLAGVRDALLSKESEVGNLREAEAETEAAITASAERISRLISGALFWVAVLGLGIATIYTFPWTLPQPRAAWWRYTLATLQVIFLFYSIVSMVRGATVSDLVERLHRWIAARVRIQLAKLVGRRGRQVPTEGVSTPE